MLGLINVNLGFIEPSIIEIKLYNQDAN